MALRWENAGPAYYISAFALLSVLCIVSGIFFLLSQRPKRRTLEWIEFVDRPGLFRGCREVSLTAVDVLLIVLLSVIAAGLQSCLMLRSTNVLSLKTFDFFELCGVILPAFVAPCVCCGCAFVMCKRVTKNSTFSFFAACLVALDVSYRPEKTVFAVLCMAFLLRWWGAELRAKRVFALLLCAVFAAVGAYASAQLWLMLLPIVLFLLFGSLLQKKFRILRFLGSLAAFAAFFALSLIAVNIPGVMYQTGLAFPQLLLDGDFWRVLSVRILQQILLAPAWTLPAVDIMSPILMIYGLYAAVFSMVAGLPRRDLRCAAVTLLFFSGAFLWLLGLVSGSVAAFLPIAYYWFAWNHRGGKRIVWSSVALLLGAELALDVILFLML